MAFLALTSCEDREVFVDDKGMWTYGQEGSSKKHDIKDTHRKEQSNVSTLQQLGEIEQGRPTYKLHYDINKRPTYLKKILEERVFDC